MRWQFSDAAVPGQSRRPVRVGRADALDLGKMRRTRSASGVVELGEMPECRCARPWM